jgi:hypothetical protein
MRTKFLLESMKVRYHCEDLRASSMITLKFFLDWIHAAHDKDRWLDPVNTVMNLWVSKSERNVLSS